jgi:serine/threonine protein kinase
MGVVCKATDTKLRRTVALEFSPASLTNDPDTRKRFIREARNALAGHYEGTPFDRLIAKGRMGTW